MTKALGLSAFLLILLSPFVMGVNIWFLVILCLIGIAIGEYRRRHKEPEVDEAQLQCQLSEFVRQINAEDGK